MTSPSSYDLPQQKGSYYYAPLQDNGPFEQRLKQLGEIIGPYIAQGVADTDTGGLSENPVASHILDEAGELGGGMMGQVIGFYIDNASKIIQNANTLINQFNDPSTWSDPFSDGLMDK